MPLASSLCDDQDRDDTTQALVPLFAARHLSMVVLIPTVSDVVEVEERAAQVVSCIQECVEILRTTTEFAPTSFRPLDSVHLWERLEPLLPRISRFVEECGVKRTRTIVKGETGRCAVVGEVLWPLLACLGESYSILDNLPPTPDMATLPRGQNRPEAPPGLLSIQNYTDIAALMEFLVCTSILPLLQSGILLSAEDRARNCLPRSLAGRIPRRSLLWGCAAQLHDGSEMGALDAVVELRISMATLGRVLLLERFRPMLLPRHLADLYAAMFQADELQKRSIVPSEIVDILIPAHYSEVSRLLLPGPSSIAGTREVNSLNQAHAYQTLLMRGLKAPLWLRQRVSLSLANLACRDLASIIHIFVRSVASDDMTAASLRLARALVSAPGESNSDEYYAAFSWQLFSLLDGPDVRDGATLDKSREARVLTVWAVIDQMPLELSMKHLFPMLSRGLVSQASRDGSNDSAHKTVGRLGTLLSSLPPSYNAWKLSRMLVSPLQVDLPHSATFDGAKVTVLGQLLRIASLQSAVAHRVKEEASVSLRGAIQTLVQSSFHVANAASVRGDEVAAMALLYCLVPTILDVAGFRHAVAVRDGGGDSDAFFEEVVLERAPRGSHEIQTFVNDMERMAKVIVESVLLPMSTNLTENECEGSRDDGDPCPLPSSIFHLLLLCHFSSIAPIEHSVRFNATSGFPRLYQRTHVHTQLSVMQLLPLVCEQCPPESLLLTGVNGSGILRMVKLILDCTGLVYGDASENAVASPKPPTEEDDREHDWTFRAGDSYLTEVLALHDDNERLQEGALDLPSHEALVSTSSIVLTLMIAMLELGSQQRSEDEESILMSMLPSLEALARYREGQRRTGNDSILLHPQIAEVAAHAMALILARSASPSIVTEGDVSNRSQRQVLIDTIVEAERDLTSEQPPIRAQGIVLLTRLAQRYLTMKDERARERPLVEILRQHGEVVKEDVTSFAPTEIVRVCVVALNDPESYVYLAAVQALVMAADLDPREVIPLIGCGVCYGHMTFRKVDAEGANPHIEVVLSTEQRIKLTEALLFTMQRRGKAVYEYVPYLMSLILYGMTPCDVGEKADDLKARIQEDTHRFFVEGHGSSSCDNETVQLSREEKVIRLKAGGPIFKSEENDILRASCITILSELVSSTVPVVVAQYSRTLMRFAVNALTLEPSRPVRRATALLCNELYLAVVREHDEMIANAGNCVIDSVADSLVVQMVDSDEAALKTALQGCMTNSNDTNPIKSRLYDPATSVRCGEALHAREEAESLGILAVARLYLQSSKQESVRPAVGIIRARLSEELP